MVDNEDDDSKDDLTAQPVSNLMTELGPSGPPALFLPSISHARSSRDPPRIPRLEILSLSYPRAANRCSRYDSDETTWKRRGDGGEEGKRSFLPLLRYLSYFLGGEGGCLICPVNNCKKMRLSPFSLHLHHGRTTVGIYESLDLVAAASKKEAPGLLPTRSSLAGDRRPRISPRFFLLLETGRKEGSESKERV